MGPDGGGSDNAKRGVGPFKRKQDMWLLDKISKNVTMSGRLRTLDWEL